MRNTKFETNSRSEYQVVLVTDGFGFGIRICFDFGLRISNFLKGKVSSMSSLYPAVRRSSCS